MHSQEGGWTSVTVGVQQRVRVASWRQWDVCVKSERMDKRWQVAKGKGITQEKNTACAKAQREESHCCLWASWAVWWMEYDLPNSSRSFICLQEAQMNGGTGLHKRHERDISWISMSCWCPSLLSIKTLLSKFENLKPILHTPFGVSVLGSQSSC